MERKLHEPERISGIDTIHGLVGTPPLLNVIPRKIMRSATMVQQAWNATYIAFIPYCFKCKVPLDWYSPPISNKIFICPNCNSCLLYTSPSPRDRQRSRMPSSA